MKNILLYSIFTNEYKKLLPLWLQYNSHNFYNGECDIIIFTDDVSSISVPDYIKVEEIKPSWPYKNLELWAKNERHCKILDKYKDFYDIFVNLQSNCLVTKPLNSTNFPIDKDKLTVFAHVSYPHCNEILQQSIAKIGSCAYRSLSSYDGVYVHAGMTMGNYEIMRRMNR